jgi:membrane protein
MERRRPEAAGAGGRNGRPTWGEILKGLLVVQIARAAERVAEKRRDRVEAGRLGGEVAAASVAVPVGRRRADEDAAREKAVEPDEVPVPAPAWRNALPIAKFVFKEFGEDNGTLMAAAVAFYVLLSLVPLVLLGVSIVAYVLSGGLEATPQATAEATRRVLGFLDQFVAIEQQQLHRTLQGLLENRGVLAGVGAAGVALAATAGFATLENAINVMWNRPNRNFIMNKLAAVAMMLAVGALLGLSVTITALRSWAGSLAFMGWLEENFIARVFGYVLPILISGLMFGIIYRFYPTGRSGWKTALTAGFITALLWELLKNAYAFYTRNFADQSATYGEGLGAAVGLVLWVYYSSALVLLGSELTWVLEGAPGREGKELAHRQRGR